MTFRPTWISWCNKSHFEMLETSKKVAWANILFWFLSLNMFTCHQKINRLAIACHRNNGSYKFLFFLRNSYVFNQNRFLISSFTKWTHNRPHSNITEDRMGKIMNFQENAVMASKLLEAMLLVTELFYWWQQLFELISCLKVWEFWQRTVWQIVETKNWEQSDQLVADKPTISVCNTSKFCFQSIKGLPRYM